MSNMNGNLPEWRDPEDESNNHQTDTEEIELPPSSDYRGDGPRDRTAMNFVFFVAVCVVLAAGWVMYIVNRTWYMGAVAILIGVGCGLLAYRVSSSTENSFILSGLAVFNAWLVYLVHRTPVLFTLAFLCLLFIPLMILRYLRGTLEEAERKSIARLNQQVTPRKRIAKLLVTNESAWQEASQHPARLTLWVLFVVLATVIFLMSAQHGVSLLPAWIIVLFISGIRLLFWWDSRFCFTNRRLLSVKGIFSVTLAETPLTKITDAIYTVPWHSRILAALRIIDVEYGTFRFETAGQKQGIEKASFVPNAHAVYRKCTEQTLRSTNPLSINPTVSED